MPVPLTLSGIPTANLQIADFGPHAIHFRGNGIDAPGGMYRTRLGNWITRFDSQTKWWRATGHVYRPTTQAPYKYVGNWDYTHFIEDGPLQVAMVTRPNSPGVRWLMRPAYIRPGMDGNKEQPEKYGWSMKLIGTRNADTEILPSSRMFRMRNAYPSTDVFVRPFKGKLEKLIVRRGFAAPTRFRLGVKPGPGQDVEREGTVLKLVDDNGVERIRTRPLWANAGTDYEGIDNTPVRISLEEIDVLPNGVRLYDIVLNADDCAAADAAGLFTFADPTAILSGKTILNDTMIIDAAPDTNFGTSFMSVGSNAAGTIRRSLFEIDDPTVNIPNGEITESRILLYQYNSTENTVGATLNAYRVLGANPWGELTATYNHYDDVNDYAGGHGSGCGVSGTDFQAAPVVFSFAYTNVTPDTLMEDSFGSGGIILQADMVPNWKDGTNAATGVVFISDDESPSPDNSRMQIRSTDQVNDPKVEIDHAPHGPLRHNGRARRD